MTLSELQQSYILEASFLGDYRAMSKTALANGYCDADEAYFKALEANINSDKFKTLRSAYFAALMLRYWYKVIEWSQNSKSLCLDYSEYVQWLAHSLYVAFYYRVWRYEYEAIVRHGKFISWKLDDDQKLIPNKYYYKIDNNAPDKIINRCCGSMRGRVYQYLNKDKRKIDTQIYSIDQLEEELGDSFQDKNSFTEFSSELESGAFCLVQELLKRGEVIEAIIVDGIINHDTSKRVKVLENNKRVVTEAFDPRKLVQHLGSIDRAFMYKFKSIYTTDFDLDKVTDKVVSLNNNQWYRHLRKTLVELKQNQELLNYLCD